MDSFFAPFPSHVHIQSTNHYPKYLVAQCPFSARVMFGSTQQSIRFFASALNPSTNQAQAIMLRYAKEMEGYEISATDGVIGYIKDFYSDDQLWVIRYLVVETGGWLASRKVLISPIGLGTPNGEQRLLPAAVSREQLKHCPDNDTDKPLSRQHERTYSSHFGFPVYWGGTGVWDGGVLPNLLMPSDQAIARSYIGGNKVKPQVTRHESESPEGSDRHLRSFSDIIGHAVHASDVLGHVVGMLIDEESWSVRYLVVDTSGWWLGHKVLVSPQWIESVNWFDKPPT